MLIGLTGRAGSGKDASWHFIVGWANRHNISVRRDAFADRLKLSAARALGFKGSPTEAIEFCNDLKQDGRTVGFLTVDDDQHICNPMALITGREYLQYYGTEAHRDVFGEDFWIDAVLGPDYVNQHDEIVVITDVRFPNEAQALREHGAEIWAVERTSASVTDDAHASEQPLPDHLIDRVILNDGTLDELKTKIYAAMGGVFVTT